MAPKEMAVKRGPGRPRGRATYYRLWTRVPHDLFELVEWAADDACEERADWVRRVLREGAEAQRNRRLPETGTPSE